LTDNPYDYDAIIIGAGTAGLSAGISLHRSGKRYLIIDKKSEIGLPVRSTGAVSKEWVDRIGMPTDNSIVTTRIRAMSFRTDLGRSISMDFGKTVGYVYDFTRYEKFLYEKMVGKLNVRMNTRVTSVERNTVNTDSESFTSKYIIFAAGPQSSFGTRLDRNNVLVAYEEIRALPRREDYQMILWFTDMAPGGYIWDFADTDNTRKIGVCFYPLNGRQPKQILDEFTDKFPEIDGNPIHSMAHQIPLSRPADSVINGNYMYTGDMVNAVLNTTAGGLQGAFWTGKSAGEAVAMDNPQYYQKIWDEEIRPWLMRHHELHRKLHRNGARSIGKYMNIAKLMPMSTKKKVFGGL
jgi:digeranylgeranylglycerophospholipid reductase